MDGKWFRDQQIVQFEAVCVDHKALCHLVKSFSMAFRNIIGWKQMFPSGGRDDTHECSRFREALLLAFS